MNENEKRSIANDIMAIARAAKAQTDTTASAPNSIEVGEGADVCILDGEAAEKYRKLLSRILKLNAAWRELFPDQMITWHVGKIVAEVRKRPSLRRASELLEAQIQEFDSTRIEVEICVPLGGIEMGKDELTLGRVILKKMTDARFDEMYQRMRTPLQHLSQQMQLQGIAGPDAAMVEKMALAYAGFLGEFRGKVCAWMRLTVGFPDKAREIADVETARMLELLRYSIPFLYPNGQRVVVGQLWELTGVFHDTPVLATDNTRFAIVRQAPGQVIPFAITEDTLEKMRGIGVFDVAAMLSRTEDHWSFFERTLVRAIHWYADAQTQRQPENIALSLAITLETFFTSRDSERPIMDDISAGVVHTLAANQEAADAIKKTVKHLYNLRSDIAHGRRADTSKVDLPELNTLVGRVIKELITRRQQFESKDALLAWVEKQRSS
jgi:hypothetical protein